MRLFRRGPQQLGRHVVPVPLLPIGRLLPDGQPKVPNLPHNAPLLSHFPLRVQVLRLDVQMQHVVRVQKLQPGTHVLDHAPHHSGFNRLTFGRVATTAVDPTPLGVVQVLLQAAPVAVVHLDVKVSALLPRPVLSHDILHLRQTRHHLNLPQATLALQLAPEPLPRALHGKHLARLPMRHLEHLAGLGLANRAQKRKVLVIMEQVGLDDALRPTEPGRDEDLVLGQRIRTPQPRQSQQTTRRHRLQLPGLGWTGRIPAHNPGERA